MFHETGQLAKMFPRFDFVPLKTEDMPLIGSWLRRPHVEAWFGPPETWMSEITQYFAEPWFEAYKVELKGRPIAYLQCIDPRAAPPELVAPYEFLRDAPVGTRALDFCIAEVDCLGRGYCARIMMQFVTRVLADPDISRLIVDPDPANDRAVRCYERAGLRRTGIVETPEGPSLLMEMTRK